MAYSVKEIFYSIQGEGANAGRPAVFCRFTGCNLWSGREEDRHSAVCQFCDTDFVGVDGEGGGRFDSARSLAEAVDGFWPANRARKFVVLTGGEPMLQVDHQLISELRVRAFQIAIETNGTLPVPRTIDWICVSPKADAELQVRAGNELKLVFPQNGVDPARYEHLPFEHFYLQPLDSEQREANTRAALDYCLANTRWRLSLQMHKMLGVR
jgi:7-carboxy-7-deazaguanine synthase (Cx14CxxC type)